MANTKVIRRSIFFLLALSFVLSGKFVGGRRIGTKESKEFVKHKGTLKTIEDMDGDIIDCVDIHQQPAFDHPLLKNHIIQMKPSSILELSNGELYNAELFQGWHIVDEECPEGTIPIRRGKESKYFAHRTIHPLARRKDLNIRVDEDVHKGHEYASATVTSGNYYGGHAKHNLWSPVTMDGDFTLSQIWVSAGPENKINTVEAGWMVDTPHGQPKFFVYWTRDGYDKTGCENLACPGFVQVNHKFVLGSPLKPVSTYKGAQYDIGITVHKDKDKWWLQVQGQEVGYWPSSIFTDLASKADSITWGGEIFTLGKEGHHTSTHMGSGHFSSEGYGKASYVRNIQYIDSNGKFIDAGHELEASATKSACYDISVVNNNNGGDGTQFYFGGPGYSAACP